MRVILTATHQDESIGLIFLKTMKSMNENGCSVCDAGSENYTTFYNRGKKYYMYDYRTETGKLFSTCAPTLTKCRERRDEWLKTIR